MTSLLEIITRSLLFSALLQLLLSIFAWSRRDEPTARPLAIVFLIGAIWAFAYSMEFAFSDFATKLIWALIRMSFNRFTALVTLWLVYEHLEKSHQLKKWIPALLVIPILSIVLIWTSHTHPLYRYDYSIRQAGQLNILVWETGPFYWMLYFVETAIYMISLYQMVRSFPETGQVKRNQTAMIILALFAPLGTDLGFSFGLSPIPGFNLTPYFMILSEMILTFAIFRYGWLRVVPMAHTALVELMPGGVLAVDAKKRIVGINPAAREILGIAAKNIIGMDFQALLSTLNLNSTIELGSQQVKKELRFERRGTRTGYFDINIVPLNKSDGKPRGHLIYFNNITSRKEEELRLIQLTQAVEQSPASVIITELDGEIIYVNPQFTALTGYSLDEAIGKNTSMLKSGKTPSETYREMWNTIKSGDTWRGEFLNKKKNGELYWELVVMSPVRDRDGKIVNFIAVKQDITARKKAEDSLRVANQQLETQLREIENLQAALREQAVRDPLTQLHNRRYLNESIEREFHYAARNSLTLSIIMIDIDLFKKINDTYGHYAGDACLVSLARILQEHTRKSDIVCRYGGEEFLILLPKSNSRAALMLAEKIRNLFENKVEIFEGHEIKMTISLGVASFPEHGRNYSEIINKADQALYTSKRAGRNHVTMWTESNTFTDDPNRAD